MRFLPVILVVCLWAALSGVSWSIGIMVNEYRNAADNGTISNSMAADEYIEFIITQDTTASQLASLTFGSTNAATSQLQGVFCFDLATLNTVLTSAGQSSFLAGTIIVVKGNNYGAENLSYNPSALNATDHDAWSIELSAGAGARDHAETTIGGNLSVDNSGGVIWVSSTLPTSKTDTSGFIDGMGHDNSPGAIANAVSSTFGANHILGSTIGAPKAVYNTADTTVSISNSTTGTMSAPNGGTNTTWIVNTLRGAVPEPSRAMLTLAGLAAALLRRSRAARRGA